MVSYIEVLLPKKRPTPNNIGEGFKVPQRQFWKEALFVQYNKNNNASILLIPIPIKYLPGGTKFLCSLISPSIKECDCSDAWKKISRHCENEISRIKGIGFDISYSPVAHAESFRINVSIEDMHRLTAVILDVSNAFQNTNVLIHERVYVIPTPYYIDWFEIY